MASFSSTQNLIPEAILLLGAMLCAGLGALRRGVAVRVHMGVAGLALAASALSTLTYLKGLPGPGYDSYSSALVVDRFTLLVVPVLCGLALVTVLSGDALAERIRPNAGEYHALLLTATLGGELLASARDMLALYVALELLSVSLYILVGLLKTEPRGSEAAFKYLILGAASSAVLLYGLAMLYGLTGTTVLTEVATGLTHTGAGAAFGIALVLAGMAFKLGAVPFHQWVPDVYEAAPAPVAGYIAAVSKLAGFAMVARFAATTLPLSASSWTAVIAVVAAASMIYGNLAALAQSRMRRLLAYSSIGQAGFILLGLLAYAPGEDGIGAALFYLLTYGITVVGVFGAVTAAEAHGITDELTSYRGLFARAPVPAVVMGVAMWSLLGIPPLIGFFAKLFVFQAATLAGWGWLVVIAVTMTVISAGYYLRVLRVIFIDQPAEGAPELEAEPLPLRAALVACAAATVVLGVLAQPLLHAATAAGTQLP